MISFVDRTFAAILEWCYSIIPNYGCSIILFTFLSKVILIPISVLVQYNSIKMVKMYPEMNMIKASYFGNKDMISEENYKLYKKMNYHPMLDLVPVIVQLVILMGVVGGIRLFNVNESLFCGFDLNVIPQEKMGIYILVPVIAALSAWFMCYIQNRINVLQAEQSNVNKYTTMALSVLLSLYLGFFVRAGVALYWTIGNLLAVVQLFLLNFFIDPRKHVDYEALRKSSEELERVIASNKAVKKEVGKEVLAREKQDYKRFFKYGRKQIVFYSEKNGFYKYYRDVIEYILARTDIVIHYITSDPDDEIFSRTSDHFRTYYIGENKMIILMMKLESDIMVMTTPDLQTYHFKKSLVDESIEYIYMDHAMGDVNLTYRKHALDHFDTIFVPNELAEREIRAQEKLYGLPEKTLVRTGYALIDNMIADYKGRNREADAKTTILIAPSWQKDNLIDLCIEEILDALLGKGYRIILRPHPQYVRKFADRLNELEKRYEAFADLEIQTDFSSNSTVYDADILMTDWSGIAYEFSFTTLKPSLYINTPMKVMNPDYGELGIEPFDVVIRDQIGISVDTDKLDTLDQVVRSLLENSVYSPEAISNIRAEYLFNIGKSGETGAKYIINKLIEYSKR